MSERTRRRTERDIRHNDSKYIRKLMSFVRPHVLYVVFAFVCGAISAVAQLSTPFIIGDAVDCIAPSNGDAADVIGLVYRLIALACVLVVGMVFTWLMNVANAKAAHLTVRDARKCGFSALTDAPIKFIDEHAHGDLSARLSVDADQIADGIIQGATQIFTGVITIIGTLAFMIRINGWIALAVAVLTPLSLLISYFIARGTHKHFKEQSRVRGELYRIGAESIDNRELIAAYGYAPQSEKKFAAVNADLKRCGLKATFYSSLVNPSTRLINSLVYAVAAVMGGLFAIQGIMTVGGITSLLLYANQFARPLNEITGVITEFQTSLAAASRVMDLTRIVPQDDSGAQKQLNGKIDINSLVFSYDGKTPVLDELTLQVMPGSLVAIVGRTGCGKTTLINLLMRFYDPDSGELLFDDTPCDQLSRSCVRGSFGMVLQDSWIFKGTVRQNIAYAKPDATLEEVISAAQKANIDGFIRRLPQGYDTIIDDGDGISQGQKQLINIARVMLADPPMLILDEATSNIDTRTEKRVQKAFDNLLRPKNGSKKTGFVVAHRLSTIINADMIIVMDAGKIVERGTHKELLRKNGVYAELYNSQFSNAAS